MTMLLPDCSLKQKDNTLMKKFLIGVSFVALLVALSVSPSAANITPGLVNTNPQVTNSQPLWYPSFNLANDQTMSNQNGLLLARGYGQCVIYGARLDTRGIRFANGQWAAATEINNFAIVRYDDGYCTGPLVNTPITVDTAILLPVWNQLYPTLRDCKAVATANGYVTQRRFGFSGGCTPEIKGVGAIFPATHPAHGKYQTFSVIKVNGAEFWHLTPYHCIDIC